MIVWKPIKNEELMEQTIYLISTGTEVMVARFRGPNEDYKWEEPTDELTINEPYFPIRYYAEINFPEDAP